MSLFEPQAIVRNYAYWVATMAALGDRRLFDNNAVIWYDAELPHPMYSYGCNISSETNTDVIPCIKDFIKHKAPFIFCNGLGDKDKPDADLLLNAGANALGYQDGMVFDLTAPTPAPKACDTLSINYVDTPKEYKIFSKVTDLASKANPALARHFFADFEELEDSPIELYIVFLGSTAVGCSMLLTPEGDVAGNYWDWVIPEYRNQGVASAMISYRIERAKELDYTHLVAQCTGDATRLYTELGFEKFCELDFYGKSEY